MHWTIYCSVLKRWAFNNVLKKRYTENKVYLSYFLWRDSTFSFWSRITSIVLNFFHNYFVQHTWLFITSHEPNIFPSTVTFTRTQYFSLSRSLFTMSKLWQSIFFSLTTQNLPLTICHLIVEVHKIKHSIFGSFSWLCFFCHLPSGLGSLCKPFMAMVSITFWVSNSY